MAKRYAGAGRGRGFRLVAGFLFVAMWPAGASAFSVAGAVELPEEAPEATAADDRQAYYWQEPNGFFPTVSPRGQAAEELIVVLRGNSPSRPESHLNIVGGRFAVGTFAVQQSTELTLTNTDPCSHTLTSEELETLRSRATPAGGTLKVTVQGVEQFRMGDPQQSQLSAVVHVFEDLAARATVSPAGAFRFENVAPGPYTLEVYRGARKVAATSVTVSDDLQLSSPLALQSGS